MWTLRCFNTCFHRCSSSWVERHGDNPAVTWVKSDKLWLPAMQCRPEASLPSIRRNWYDWWLDDIKDVIDFHLNTFTWIGANLISKCDHGLDECPWACYAYAYFSCYIFWFGEFMLCFMNDNIIVECSINVNITIAINYFVNINWRLRVTFYKEVVPLWGHNYIAIQRCKLHRATCRRFDTIPACDGRTDGQTELP